MTVFINIPFTCSGDIVGVDPYTYGVAWKYLISVCRYTGDQYVVRMLYASGTYDVSFFDSEDYEAYIFYI